MKKFLLTLALVGVSFASFAQGTLNFNNKVGTTVDAKISYGKDGLGAVSGTGAGAGITAQLALVAPGGSLTLLTPTTTFKTASAGQKFYINGLSMVIPATAANQSVTVRVLAFSTAAGSYAAASTGNQLWYGASNDISVTLGGPVSGAPDALPGNLVGLTGFTMTYNDVPEPTTLALLGLGGLALAIRRRK